MAEAAIIVASGSSRRMGFDKLAADLSGRPVLRRAVEAFLALPELRQIVVVSPIERFNALLADLIDPRLVRCDGGTERQDSVRAGLDVLMPDIEWVAVHDGARPLILPRMIRSTFKAARADGAAALARPVVETLKRADPEGFAGAPVSRDDLWIMETPQTVRVADLRAAAEAVASECLQVTDEVSALEAVGIRTRLVASTSPNLKITHPGDLTVAAALLAAHEG